MHLFTRHCFRMGRGQCLSVYGGLLLHWHGSHIKAEKHFLESNVVLCCSGCGIFVIPGVSLSYSTSYL
jgi:hypothetical protein